MCQISIITVNLNNKSGLERTINSVINQKEKLYEFIVIDGDSTDGSKELLEKYSKQIDYWVSEKDNGIYNAMNKGIRNANGDYLLFLNSGDFLVDNKEIVNNIISQIDNQDIITFNGNILHENLSYKSIRKHITNISLSYVYERGFKHQSTLIKKSLFTELGLYDESFKVAGDYEFWIRAFTKKTIKYENFDFEISNFVLGGVSQNSNWYKEHRKIEDLHLKNFLLDLEELNKLRYLNKLRFLIPISKWVTKILK